MHPIVEGFMERPRSQKAAAWIGSLALITFVFWQYFYKDLLDQSTDISDKIEQLRIQINEKGRIARNLEKFRKEVKELEVKLKYALQELPDKREIPDLLSSISTKAKDAGLEVSLFKPSAEIPKDFYADVPVSISVEGTYHELATFFDEVAHLPRIVNINQITVRDPKLSDTKVLLKADCTATTFRYLEESERVQLNQQDDQKKRRKH